MGFGGRQLNCLIWNIDTEKLQFGRKPGVPECQEKLEMLPIEKLFQIEKYQYSRNGQTDKETIHVLIISSKTLSLDLNRRKGLHFKAKK